MQSGPELGNIDRKHWVKLTKLETMNHYHYAHKQMLEVDHIGIDEQNESKVHVERNIITEVLQCWKETLGRDDKIRL